MPAVPAALVVLAGLPLGPSVAAAVAELLHALIIITIMVLSAGRSAWRPSWRGVCAKGGPAE